jgi:hypothetical protein
MNREDMIEMYSDFHKDAYGFRPHFIDVNSLSDAELQADFDRFDIEIENNILRDTIAGERAIVDFKELILEAINNGAENEDQAIRWLVDAHFDLNGNHNIIDIEYFVWCHGILYTDYGRTLVKKIGGLLYNQFEESIA